MALGSSRRRLLIAGSLLLLAGLLRVYLLQRFPELTTTDSVDYLLAGRALERQGLAGLFTPPTEGVDARALARLGDWRLPGYPLALAAWRARFGPDCHALLTAQALLGVLAAVAAAALGHRLGGLRAAVGLGLFVACHPAYLLFEHVIHPETLALALVLGGVATLVWSAQEGRWAGAALAGALLGASLVTRANALPLVAVLWLGLPLTGLVGAPAHERRRGLARGLGWALAVGLGLGLTLAPWLVRQVHHVGQPVVVANTERGRLVYLAQHGLFQPNLAGAAGAAWVPGHPDTIFHVAAALGRPPAQAEATAAEVFARHGDMLGLELQRARLRATVTFLGLPNYDPVAAGRHDVRFWFRWFIAEPREVLPVRRALKVSRQLLRDRPPPRRPNAATATWARLGDRYLVFGRPLLLLLCAGLVAWRLHRRTPFTPREWALALLLLGWFATAALHGYLLADYDRFAVPFDWIPALVVGYLAPRVSLRG